MKQAGVVRARILCRASASVSLAASGPPIPDDFALNQPLPRWRRSSYWTRTPPTFALDVVSVIESRSWRIPRRSLFAQEKAARARQ